jgi:hypothetical protein
MQKVPALFKLRYGKDEKVTQRVSSDVMQVAVFRKPSKVCRLLTPIENCDRLYTIVDYDKSGQAKHTFNT